MDIRSYTTADMRAALLSDDFWRTKTLPTTKPRALSFSHNPRADVDDIVLLVACQGEEVIGYLGVLPDRLHVCDQAYRIGWLTGWWVDPQRASAGVGTALLFKALNAYGQQIGVSGSSAAARRVLLASQRFMPAQKLKGLDIQMGRGCAEALLRQDTSLDRLSFEYIAAIDNETEAVIKQHYRHDLTRKEKADLDWIMRYPWILTAPAKDSASRRYYFSSIAARFEYLGVKVFERRKGLIGFFMLKMRNDRLALIYCFFDDSHTDLILSAAAHHALAMNAAVLSLYDLRLVSSFAGLPCPADSVKTVSRSFFLSKAFAGMPLAQMRIQGGDGDLAFY